MAEFVEYALERLLPFFEQLQFDELLTHDEVQCFIKQCRRYEYQIAKQVINSKSITPDINLILDQKTSRLPKIRRLFGYKA